MYRGKHPSRIKEVWSPGHFGRGLMVRTNDGRTFCIAPITSQGSKCAPKAGHDLSVYQDQGQHYSVNQAVAAVEE